MGKPLRLHVNIDHVATLRNARGTPYPDPVRAALECLAAGADGITAHLREDRRHIRDEDVVRLRAEVKTTFNLELAANGDMVSIARRVRPDVVTFVPERREERTTEGGLDVAGGAVLRSHVKTLAENGTKISMFIAAEADQVRASKEIGAKQVEFHTGEYAHKDGEELEAELLRIASAAKLATELGLEVAAGHGLTTGNVGRLVRIPEIEELNIGHAIISDAVFLSLRGAVEAMRASIRASRG